MVSSVTEEDITKLREAGYLAADITHRLPDEGQIIPTPEPHERVVFLPHFVRGLGFPLHPFVRGLMFYYGLDFHDLAPNFILNISAFIVVVRGLPSHQAPLRPMAEDLQCETKGGGRTASGVRRRHGGQNAQRHLARRLLCVDHKGVVIGVVLHHRAAQHQLGGGPQIQIWNPHAAHFLGKEGPGLGRTHRVDRT